MGLLRQLNESPIRLKVIKPLAGIFRGAVVSGWIVQSLAPARTVFRRLIDLAQFSMMLQPSARLLQLVSVRRSSRKFLCEREKLKTVAFLERRLAYPVLLGVMMAAQADRPFVGRLETLPSISSLAHMSTLDGKLQAARHAATVTPDPGAVG